MFCYSSSFANGADGNDWKAADKDSIAILETGVKKEWRPFVGTTVELSLSLSMDFWLCSSTTCVLPP